MQWGAAARCGGREACQQGNVHHGGGAPARGLNGNLLQLEFKIQATFGASNGASWGPDRERIMGVTSDSIVRRQPMMAEGFSLFRKRT